MVELEYKLEPFVRPAPGPVEAFARGVSSVLASMPLAIPAFPFGRAACMSSGLLDADTGLWSEPPNPDGDQRIRLIEHAGQPLLTFRYDDAGHLIETVFPGNRTEHLLRAADGRVTAVRWCDSDMTRFGYHENARFASIVYADGASFQFQSNPKGVCDTWRYPDGKACVAAWDNAGLLDSLTCGDVCVRYGWRGSSLAWIATGEQRLPLDSRRLSVPFEQMSAGSSGIRQMESAIGRWSYDHNNIPIELVSPLLARLRRLKDESQRTVTIWTPTGQTVWRFTRRGLLDSIVHADGTRTIFVNSSIPNNVFALSSRGVEILCYRDGRLAASRAMDGAFNTLQYDRYGNLVSLKSMSSEVRIRPADANTWLQVRTRGEFTAKVNGNSSGPSRLHVRVVKGTGDYFSSLVAATAWLWNWVDTPRRMRLHNRLQES